MSRFIGDRNGNSTGEAAGEWVDNSASLSLAQTQLFPPWPFPMSGFILPSHAPTEKLIIGNSVTGTVFQSYHCSY